MYDVTKDAYTGKWIIRLTVGNLSESDELARRRGQWNSRREAEKQLADIKLRDRIMKASR